MKESNDRILRVAALLPLLLPLFIFLATLLAFSSMSSVSYASYPSPNPNPNDIYATVRVVPSAATWCTPDPFVAGHPKEKTFTCYIELDTVSSSKIIPDTLRLSLVERPVVPIPVLKNSPNKVGDFDKDGVPDMKVTFDKIAAGEWFSDLYMPTDFTFKVTGEIKDIPYYTFTAIDTVKVIKPSYIAVRFYGSGGSVRTIKGIDLTKATIRGSRMEKSGHQMITLHWTDFINSWEDIAGTVTGSMPVEIFRGRYVNLGFTARVRYNDNGCAFATSPTPDNPMECDGKGLFVKSGLAVGYSAEDVDVHFETDGVTATLIARRDGVVVFEQSDVPLKRFDFEIKTTPWYLFAS